MPIVLVSFHQRSKDSLSSRIITKLYKCIRLDPPHFGYGRWLNYMP
jgi:hypothetical protein